MTYTRNRAIVLAITDGGMSVKDAATHFGVSTRWLRTLIKRFRTGGLEALHPHSKRPHTNPNQTPEQLRETILALRHQLQRDGLDAGAETIYDLLPEQTRPSTSTIFRILKTAGTIQPQPQKRPRSSWQRFQAPAPNSLWQSDFTHWPLADGTDTEIISWLDDHSRYLTHISVHPRITGRIVVNTFLEATETHGLPAATLTDNGLVYTTRLAGGRTRNKQPNPFEQLLADLNIEQKNGHPGKPTTQGKIERFHRTLKTWLKAQPPAQTHQDLQQQLHDFQTLYNTQRKHRAINRRTPHQAYTATPKDQPTTTLGNSCWRVRYDRVDAHGKITLRYAGKLRHLGIGHAHNRQRIILLVNGPQALAINKTTGEIIGEYTIDPTKNYQPKKRNDVLTHHQKKRNDDPTHQSPKT